MAGLSEDRGAILSWLSTLDMDKELMKSLCKRIEGTAEWILQTPEFAKWSLAQGQSRMLWCHGLEGSGLTTMFSVVVDHFRRTFTSPEFALAYIYCDDGGFERSQYTALMLLSCMCRQLAEQSKELPPYLVKLYRQIAPNGEQLGIDEVTHLLVSLCGTFDKVVICIDTLGGLREGETSILLSKLKWMSNHGALIFLTNCTHGDLPEACGCHEDIIRAFENENKLLIRAKDEDIRACVWQRLRNHSNKDELNLKNGEAATIVDEIVADSGGMFPVAQFKLDKELRRRKKRRLEVDALLEDTSRHLTSKLDHLEDSRKDLDTAPLPCSSTYTSSGSSSSSRRAMPSPPPSPPLPSLQPPPSFSWSNGPLSNIPPPPPSSRPNAPLLDIMPPPPSSWPNVPPLDSLPRPPGLPVVSPSHGGPVPKDSLPSPPLPVIPLPASSPYVPPLGIPPPSPGFPITAPPYPRPFPEIPPLSEGPSPDLSHLPRVYSPPKTPIIGQIPPSLGFCNSPTVPFRSLSATTCEPPPFPLSSAASKDDSFPTWKQKPKLREFALRLLSWVIYTKEPLTLNELVQAVMLEDPLEFNHSIIIKDSDARIQGFKDREPWEIGESVPEDQTSSKPRKSELDRKWGNGISLFDICKGWIRVQDDTKEVHLSDIWWKWSLPPNVVDRIFPNVHYRIAATCLNCLSRNDTIASNQVAQMNQPDRPWVPFKRYAERFWVAHYLESGDERLDDLAVAYFNKIYRQPASWIEERRPMWSDKYHVIVTDDETPLLKVARLGQNKILEKLLLTQKYDINAKSSNWESAISVSVAAGYTSTVQLLYRYGASIHFRNSRGWSLLHMAAERDDDVMVVLLIWCGLKATTLSAGLDPEQPLLVAARENSVNAASILLNHGATILTPGIMREAARQGHEDFVRMLVERGFDLSARFSPLWEAVSSGSLPLVEYLIRHGANPCQVDDELIHPAIHRAADEGHLEILKLLLEHGADPWRVRTVREGVSKFFERTAIEEAMWGCHSEVVDFLLSRLPNDLPKPAMLGITVTAIRSKSPEVLHFMLERLFDGVEPEEKREYEQRLITVAVSERTEETLKLLLDRGFEFTFMDENGSSPLHVAAASGTADIALMLLEHGADMHGRTKENKSPIGIAARAWNIGVLSVLLDWNTQTGLPIEDDFIVVETAESGHSHKWKEAVRLLLSHGAPVDGCNADGETALHYAVLDNDIDLVRDLLGHGINTSMVSRRGGSPLHFAAFKGYMDIVKELVCHGAIVDLAYDFEGDGYKANHTGDESTHRPHDWGPIEKQWTPLHSAACGGHDAVADFLLKQGAQVSPKALSGDTPLHVAASAGEPTIVKMLLERGADVSGKQAAGNTPLHSVARATMVSSMKKLHERFMCNCKLAKEAQEVAKLPPTRRWIDCVAILVHHGADLGVENSEGLTPLAVAVCCDNHEVVKAFIDHIPSNLYTSAAYLKLLNACVGTTSAKTLQTISSLFKETEESREEWDKILIAACDAGNYEMVVVALEKGARASSRTADGTYLLHQAIAKGHVNIVRSLLLAGADLNITNSLGRNALHIASAHRGEKTLTVKFDGREKELIAENLLREGAQVNSRTPDGDTALHFAVSTGVVTLVRLLIRSGASIDIRNRRGLTPLHAAVATWIFPEIIEILLGNDACPTAQDHAGFTPMHLIRDTWERGGRAVDILASNGGDHSVRARNGDRPIHCAIRRSNWNVFERLLHAGASILDRGAKGRTVLHIAAKHNRGSLVDRLIRLGADPGAVDNDGWTALHHAVHGQHMEVISTLVQLTAKIGPRPTGTGVVPLSKALKHDSIEVVKVLLDAGYDLDKYAWTINERMNCPG
jgi:ankyrin repeat protein